MTGDWVLALPVDEAALVVEELAAARNVARVRADRAEAAGRGAEARASRRREHRLARALGRIRDQLGEQDGRPDTVPTEDGR